MWIRKLNIAQYLAYPTARIDILANNDPALPEGGRNKIYPKTRKKYGGP